MITAALSICLIAGTQAPPLTDKEVRIIGTMSPVPPAPPDSSNRVADNAEAAMLGAMVFNRSIFSSNGAVSCATCHQPGRSFTDARAVAQGVGVGTRNSPPLGSVAHQRWFFWDGRSDSLWSQALSPFENPLEIDSTRVNIVRVISQEPDLKQQYEALFGELPDMGDAQRFPDRAKPGMPAWDAMSQADRTSVTRAFVNVGKSVAAFERTLTVGRSPFDRFAQALKRGKPTDGILSPAAVRGLQLFIGEAGCRNCHSGPLFTDRGFHNQGLPTADGLFPTDPGRAGGLESARSAEFRLGSVWSDDPEGDRARRAGNATAGPEHWGAMKTPSLRNLPTTGPYMHDGRFHTLAQTLAFYNTLEGHIRIDHHQETILKPLHLPPEDILALEAFLESLQDGAPDARSGKNKPLIDVDGDPMLDASE